MSFEKVELNQCKINSHKVIFNFLQFRYLFVSFMSIVFNSFQACYLTVQ